jgi:hypothetical protein
LVGAVIGVMVLALPAFATFTTPNTNPFTLSVDGSGNPLPFDVVVSGYPTTLPKPNIFEEICDGTPSTAQGWDPTINCDAGTAGSSTQPDASGNVSFPASDPNKHVNPFRGESPSGLFNCIHTGDTPPANGLPTFDNCQLRVSSNNTASTSDQQFLTMTLPGSSPVTPEVPYAVLLPLGAIAVGGGYFLIRRRRAAHASA